MIHATAEAARNISAVIIQIKIIMSKMLGMQILSILIVLICNSWTWELFSFNLYLLLIIWGLSILLYLSVVKLSKKFLYIFCLFLIPVLIIQWITTKNSGLNYINATDEHIFATRRYEISMVASDMKRYLGSKPEYMFHKFEQNLLRSMDLNLYFFGNHPREISGMREFEKFSFLLLPFFILGLLEVVNYYPRQLLGGLIIPLSALSIIGLDNLVGPFILFPFISVTIAIGMLNIVKKV